MVTFSLNGRDFGIDIFQVKEIAKFNYFTYIPNSIYYVRGVYNLRGDIISVIDLRILFGTETGYSGYCAFNSTDRKANKVESGLILRGEDSNMVGAIIDKVDKVIAVPSAKIKPPHPIFGTMGTEYMRGIIEDKGKLFVILDVNKLIINSEDIELSRKNMKIPSLGNLKDLEDTGKIKGYDNKEETHFVLEFKDASEEAEEEEIVEEEGKFSFIRSKGKEYRKH